jgi:hypothetical protein
LKTTTVQIDNSDDKLTQKMWSHFVDEVDNAIKLLAAGIHFSGGSSARLRWQNYAWVFNVADQYREPLSRKLAEIRKTYNQDSIAWTEGETLFV